jgi:hypothetical protein
MRIKPLYALRNRKSGKLLGGLLEIDDRFMLRLTEPAHIVKVSKGALLVFDTIEAAQKVLEKRNRKLSETCENPAQYLKEIEIVELRIVPLKPD